MLSLPSKDALQKSSTVRLGLILLIGFALFSLLALFRIFVSSDIALTEFLQSITPRFLDTPFSILSLLGTFEITGLILVLLLLKSKLSWFEMGVLVAGFIVILGVETTLKHVLKHPRPPAIYDRYDLPIFLPTSRVETPFAYPSGHLSRTTYLLAIAWLLLASKSKSKRNYLTVLWLIGILMAISRVYLGEHWTSDVIGGSLLGSGIGYLTFGILTVSNR